MNRMYLVEVSEYINCIKTKIINYYICDALDDAIEKGKSFIKDYKNKMQNSDLYIDIFVYSTNRKIFNTPKDIMNYFNNNIKNISNTNLYDFLLSLVEYDCRSYSCSGEYISNMIFGRRFLKNNEYLCNLEFTEESCMNGIYEFWFKEV